MVPLSSLSREEVPDNHNRDIGRGHAHGSEVVRSANSGVSSSAVASSSSYVGLIVGLGALLA